jgi:type I restriction enzyme S subunit
MNTVPLRRIARLVYGEALASDIRGEGEVPVIGSGGQSGHHSQANTFGPAIIVGRKGSYGTIHWSPRDCFVIDTAYSVRPSEGTDIRWLYYALQAVDLKGVSQDVGVPGLSREAAYSVEIPLCLLDEQRRVADFLDREAAKIDQLIFLRLLQAKQLEEYETAWRSRLFLMSKSGSWTRVKHLLRTKPRYGVLVPEFADAGVPFIRVSNLSVLPSLESLPKISEALSFYYPRTVTMLGDVLVCVVGGTIGKTAVVPKELVGANTARAVAVMRLKRVNVSSLFASWFGTAEFKQQAVLATGADSAQPTLGMEDLANFSIKWPTDSTEEKAMVEVANESQIRLAAARSALSSQVSLVAERQRALITAAVTGQIDVRTARTGGGVTA